MYWFDQHQRTRILFMLVLACFYSQLIHGWNKVKNVRPISSKRLRLCLLANHMHGSTTTIQQYPDKFKIKFSLICILLWFDKLHPKTEQLLCNIRCLRTNILQEQYYLQRTAECGSIFSHVNMTKTCKFWGQFHINIILTFPWKAVAIIYTAHCRGVAPIVEQNSVWNVTLNNWRFAKFTIPIISSDINWGFRSSDCPNSYLFVQGVSFLLFH